MRKSPLSESLPLGSERFSTNKQVVSSIDTIHNAAAMLNEDLQPLTSDYDSLVVFSHTPGEAIAAPVGHANADNVDPKRYEFRNSNILNRAVLLQGTSLGETLSNPESIPLIASSKINHDYGQITYTHPLKHDDDYIGAVQLSFTASGKNGSYEYQPDGDEIRNAWLRSGSEMRALAAEISHLQLMNRELGSLATRLEYEDPIMPNAFIIRWDIEGSKKHAASEQRRMLKAYINQATLRIRAISEEYQREYSTQFEGGLIYDDQGDGANIILRLPEKWDKYSQSILNTYKTYTADPFMNELTRALNEVGGEYLQDLNPQVRIEGAFGYVEPNSIGRFTAHEMFELGAQKAK